MQCRALLRSRTKCEHVYLYCVYGTVPCVYGAVGEVACGETRVAPPIGRLVAQEAAQGNHEECICVFCVIPFLFSFGVKAIEVETGTGCGHICSFLARWGKRTACCDTRGGGDTYRSIQHFQTYRQASSGHCCRVLIKPDTIEPT